ncbi:MAG TPA: GMC family oxidoreductase [Solirubrobacterales bacterium]|nr:GMC family oxidoreductase [Solirubrobacterales bacterium]
MSQFDYDWIVVGSGFGGSVSALRLAEKGYSVGVLECGSRFRDEDFAESTLRQPRRYFWVPKLGFRGVLRISFFRDVLVVSGSGVGGGSLGYANTLYRARPSFFEDPQWAELDNWELALAPHYDTAERMLGVTEYEGMGPADKLLKEYSEEIGVGETFTNTRVGVFFDRPGQQVPDPYFEGEGPDRTGCMRCGSCMVGCRHGAKNTLMKNYLWFAEKLGVEVKPERQVTEIRPLGAADGSDGYAITVERSGSWFGRGRQTLTAKGVVVAAGALGTNHLLANCKHSGALPRLSDQVGAVVRTNSESIQAVTARDDERDFSRSVAITSSIYPDPDTHIEVVTYGEAGDAMNGTFTTATGDGTKLTRPLKWLLATLRNPLQALRGAIPYKWSRRTVILLVMQTVDAAMHLKPKRKLFGRGVRLQTEQDAARPNPTFIPAAEQATRWFAKRMGGMAQSAFTESWRNTPTTAHILGGAVIGSNRERGVVDAGNRVFGYENLMVTDGSSVPANPGVNPSLTITAKAEHAMSLVPPKEGAEPRHLPEAARPATPVAR